MKNPLGKPTKYSASYNASLLFPIARQDKRKEIAIENKKLPFHGIDCWNAYEISWLGPKGKPEVRLGRLLIPADSPNIVESKSLKLYLNSFNQSIFQNEEEVKSTIGHDLNKILGCEIKLELFHISDWQSFAIKDWDGTCLDSLDVSIDNFNLNPDLLAIKNEQKTETLYSHLLKSNCLVTNQPDWASVLIKYSGPQIDHESLLKYLISFREHNEFHEQCVERIFQDLLTHCQCEKLTVYARYTRRGGLDINPFRSNFEDFPMHHQIARQ